MGETWWAKLLIIELDMRMMGDILVTRFAKYFDRWMIIRQYLYLRINIGTF